MTGSISALRSSFSFLSFSSKIYRRPNDLIFPQSKSLSISLAPKPASLTISASVASPPQLETMDFKKLVKSRLPGGFAAHPIIGTCRRKCVIGHVDLQEGTRKVVPNSGDAKVFFVVRDSLGELRMSGPECCSNPPTLNPSSGAGHVEKLGGLNTYVAGPADSNRVVILLSDVFGYEAPNLRKLADKVAAAGFYVVVPDFFYGDPYDQYNPERPVSVWYKDHGTDKGVEDAKLVIEALKSKGVSAIGAAGFCWGGKVVVELAKPQFIQAALMLHPSMVTVDDIKGVEVPIAILGAEIDKFSPPALLKQFEEVLAAKNEVESYVKIFPKVSHGWSVRYSLDDPAVVSAAEEAHQNLLEWFSKYVK